MLNNDNEVRRLVIKEFGEKSYDGNKPDKKYLSEIVFNNPDELKKLNSIIHPRTIDIIESENGKSFAKVGFGFC